MNNINPQIILKSAVLDVLIASAVDHARNKAEGPFKSTRVDR